MIPVTFSYQLIETRRAAAALVLAYMMQNLSCCTQEVETVESAVSEVRVIHCFACFDTPLTNLVSGIIIMIFFFFSFDKWTYLFSSALRNFL